MMASPTEIPAERLPHEATFTPVTYHGDANNGTQSHDAQFSGPSHPYIQPIPNMRVTRHEVSAPTFYPILTYHYPVPNIPQATYQVPEYNETTLGPNDGPQSYAMGEIDGQAGTAHSRLPLRGHHRYHPYRVYADNVAGGNSDAISGDHTGSPSAMYGITP
ncbi:hypothetical protein BO78DRAFT_438030 [Aspergillus sclerotiicarbonarius CBS 121057]|uniref:Uncharacterized protein n=1 Tax=Aspergillus sclerotiicarbonarius (strain CBS 121057 / IBT 28362) TaxID=1448318 RepID=A0A319EGJ0_ASPSB|nr:hypothetical protein BO78DRAFT_438030 [Aspergillus sclerotiicarbonarius CBS 121057]